MTSLNKDLPFLDPTDELCDEDYEARKKEREEFFADGVKVIEAMKNIKMLTEMKDSIEEFVIQQLENPELAVEEDQEASRGQSDTLSEQHLQRMQREKQDAQARFNHRTRIIAEGARRTFAEDKAETEERKEKVRTQLQEMEDLDKQFQLLANVMKRCFDIHDSDEE
ncbi:uncharacterized protein LOC132255482 [Phlebotomus argentipes]|uniref:uncharacterized protein LOC132255482 n=1 Tax=Phlebotomus argentipes TaxID=94469 RepID=UPI0028932C9A|nr:uncharacterized protein LOC132255482 [Phlebotomus argentipes]